MVSFNGVKMVAGMLVASCAFTGCLERNLPPAASLDAIASTELMAPVVTSPSASVYISDASTLVISGMSNSYTGIRSIL